MGLIRMAKKMCHRLREQERTHEEGLLDAAVVGDVLALRVGAVDARLDAVHAVAAVLIWKVGKSVHLSSKLEEGGTNQRE